MYCISWPAGDRQQSSPQANRARVYAIRWSIAGHMRAVTNLLLMLIAIFSKALEPIFAVRLDTRISR